MTVVLVAKLSNFSLTALVVHMQYNFTVCIHAFLEGFKISLQILLLQFTVEKLPSCKEHITK